MTANDLRGSAPVSRRMAGHNGSLYVAASLPPDFAYPDESPRSKVIDECLIPLLSERNIPFAMMIGVKRQVNPACGWRATGLGRPTWAPSSDCAPRTPTRSSW